RQLALAWGGTPAIIENLRKFEDMTAETRKAVLSRKLAQKGDNVVVTAGIPFGKPGTTNMLYVLEIK
ncbi:MAG: pyruvate kinase, partial [Elusimicrobiaceae bacterium]|nr:pyruvate kinase [Elusimicrobiaceae bacterium]